MNEETHPRSAALARFFTGWWGALILVILLTVIVGCFVTGPYIATYRPLPFDTYRDIAYARSLLLGRGIMEDPTVEGARIWYPPLNPMFIAALSKVTGERVDVLYALSPLFINLFVPLLFFLLVARWFGFRVGLASVFLLPVPLWLRTHLLTMGMPSVHSFVVVLAALGVFSLLIRRIQSPGTGLFLGLVGGLVMLHHSLSGLVYVGAIGLFLLWESIRLRSIPHFRGLVLFGVTAFIVSAPYTVPNALVPKLNPAPLAFVAQELKSLDFILWLPNRWMFWLFWGLWLAGVVSLLAEKEKTSGMRLLLCVLVVSALGQVPGYLTFLPALQGRTMALVPHEFQWYFQLFSLVVVAVGWWRLLWSGGRWRKLAGVVALLLLCVPAWARVSADSKKYLVFYVEEPPRYTKWINENIESDAVIVVSHPQIAYRYIQPQTARRIVHIYPPHMNFGVDVQKRGDLQYELLFDAGKDRVDAIVRELGIDYIFLWRRNMPHERVLFFGDSYDVVYSDSEFDILRVDLSPREEETLQ